MRKYTANDNWFEAVFHGVEFVKKNYYETGPTKDDG